MEANVMRGWIVHGDSGKGCCSYRSSRLGLIKVIMNLYAYDYIVYLCIFMLHDYGFFFSKEYEF